jgi:hypothetical protein
MAKRLLYWVLIIALLADIGFSFLQHLNQSLDGDMAWNLIPAADVKPILDNPLGIKTILYNQTYVNPNRFFCHWSFREYLLNAPLLLQKFSNPIDSVYLACAISKSIIQTLLIMLLSMIITGSRNIRNFDFLVVAVLITPLFQTNGYRSYMGIIDPSTTYTFFYALPSLILIFYFSPVFFKYYHGITFSFSPIARILWFVLAFIVCLSGPLNPGIILTLSMLIILSSFKESFIDSKQNKLVQKILNTFQSIPLYYWYLFILFSTIFKSTV